jgi:hypothetical protein
MDESKNIPKILPTENSQLVLLTSPPKRSLISYFKEFLMLFLAVFCGFLAENYRDNLTERSQEKKYIQSLLMDINDDTAEISKSIIRADFLNKKVDSLILYLHYNALGNHQSEEFTALSFFALGKLDVFFNEVTAMQLKNAGNLRLIQNQDMIRKISVYWKEQENTKILLDRILLYRNRGREYEEKLFAKSQNLLIERGIMPGEDGVSVIRKDPALWSEYANVVWDTGGTRGELIIQLQKQLMLANDLVASLKKEYQLSE